MTDDRASLQDLAGRVDDFLLRQMKDRPEGYALRELVPQPSWNRFDLGAKLLYLDALRGQPSQFAERLYAAHIAAFSLGDMAEPGNDAKVGLDRFTADFIAIYRDMEANGYDPTRSLVPLARDGSLLNAGHRAACAIALGQPVVALETGLEPKYFDAEFFATRGMAPEDVDATALRLIEAMPHATVALLWPAARGKDQQVAELLGPLIHRKSVSLSLRGGHNLLAQVYRGEPWLGDPAEDYPGIKNKLMACFNGSDDLRLLVFDAPPSVDRIALKDRVRALYGIAKSSVHMTDSHAEAVEIAQLLLNPNARHFLDHGAPMTFPETRSNLLEAQDFLGRHAISPRNVAVDTGMLMGLYGLRAPSDIDVVSAVPLPPGPLEAHDMSYRDIALGDLLQDPARHFVWQGLTFVSLREVAALKSRRLAGQDREDLLLIAPLLTPGGPAQAARPLTMRLRMRLLRLRRSAIRTLFRLKIGAPLQRLYRRFNRRPRITPKH